MISYIFHEMEILTVRHQMLSLYVRNFVKPLNDTPTTIGALKPKSFKAPILFSALFFPLIFPFCLRDHADIGIHLIRTSRLHLLCYMAVDIQSKRRSVMS